MAPAATGDAWPDRASTALLRSEERLRLLVESVVDYAIFVLDPDGTVASWNAGAERLKGYREDEIVGRHYSVFYPPELREAGLPQHLLAEAHERGRVEHTGWRLRADGSRFWADVVITALRDEAGRHAGFAKVTRDRTEAHEADQARERALAEQREAIARLRDLDRWRREFTASVVHDLQTPVTAIASFAEFLGDDGFSADERGEFVERIRSNARALRELVDNLRADAHLTEGRARLEPEPIALSPFVGRIIDDMRPVLADHPITAELGGVSVEADRPALERVLRNLLANAAQHTPSGTAVTVAASRDEDVVTLTVTDDGPGIAEPLLSRLFDRFESGDRRGTGLGLDITRRYVELHGGTVTAASQPGEGTRFLVTLPARAAAEPADRPAPHT